MHDVRGEQWVVASTAPVGSQAAAVESWSTGDREHPDDFFRDRAPPRHGDLELSRPFRTLPLSVKNHVVLV